MILGIGIARWELFVENAMMWTTASPVVSTILLNSGLPAGLGIFPMVLEQFHLRMLHFRTSIDGFGVYHSTGEDTERGYSVGSFGMHAWVCVCSWFFFAQRG